MLLRGAEAPVRIRINPDLPRSRELSKLRQLAFRFNDLRLSMRAEAHPRTDAAYRCRVSIGNIETDGFLLLEPVDTQFSTLLVETDESVSSRPPSATAAPTLREEFLDDFDALIGDDESSPTKENST